MPKSAKEYHLISLSEGQSYDGFVSLTGARQYAREENIENWNIYRGNGLVERHCPTGSVENSFRSADAVPPFAFRYVRGVVDFSAALGRWSSAQEQMSRRG